MNKTWYVVYFVSGYEGEKKAGPYSLRDALVAKADIEGYEHVYDVCMRSEEVI